MREHLALAVGEADDLVAAAQLAAPEVEDERAEADAISAGGARRRPRPLEDVGDAQRQLARLERLGDIVVGADLEPVMRLSASSRAVSIRIGTVERLRMARASSKPFSPGIITSRIEQIEAQAFELGPRLARRSRRW